MSSLLTKLRAALDTEVIPNPDWETATNAARDRRETVGILNHFDANRGTPDTEHYLSDNRFNGILYHILIRRNGVVELLSQRYVYHAGKGDRRVYEAMKAGKVPPNGINEDMNGNPYYFSVSINYHPDFDGAIPAAQYRALLAVNAVLVDHFNLSVNQIADHATWTDRKRDIDEINWTRFRTQVESLREGGEDMFVFETDPNSKRKERLVEYWSRQLKRAGQAIDPRNTDYEAMKQPLWNVVGYGVGGVGPGEADAIMAAVRAKEGFGELSDSVARATAKAAGALAQEAHNRLTKLHEI